MENRDVASVKRTISVKTLLPTILSAVSVLMTVWISYQSSQLTPKVDDISDRVAQLQTQVDQTSGGVTGLQQVDQARKQELFKRLTAKKSNSPAEVQQAFREVFPEDKFWADQSLTRPATPAPTKP